MPRRGGAHTPPSRHYDRPAQPPDLVPEHPVADRRIGGNHVPEFHSQVRQSPPPGSLGGGFAPYGPRCRPCFWAGPGPVPAPRHRRRHPGQPGPADGGAEEGGRFRGPPHLQPPDRRPLLRHPPPRHRRLAHQHLPGQGRRETALRRLGVHLRVPGPGRAARASPRTGLPAGAGRARASAAATTTSSTP